MISVAGFKNVIAVLDFFNTKEKCASYLEQQRWPNGVCCPNCGHEKVYRTARGFKCANKDCSRKHFSVISGTVFENTKVELRFWFAAIYLITAHKKGISSHQLGRDLGVSQKTAWFLNHRIREMMKDCDTTKLQTSVAADETFIGGKNANRHKDKKVKGSQGRSAKDKTPVLGLLEKDGKMKTFQVPDTAPDTLQPILEKHIEEGATLMTDEWAGYMDAKDKFVHKVVRHSAKQYVDGMVHVNGVENYWSHLKRSITGIYHWVSRKHLERYCDEMSYRFNSRKIDDRARFEDTFANCNRRLRWDDLVYGKAPETIDIDHTEIQESPETFSSMKEYERFKKP